MPAPPTSHQGLRSFSGTRTRTGSALNAVPLPLGYEGIVGVFLHPGGVRVLRLTYPTPGPWYPRMDLNHYQPFYKNGSLTIKLRGLGAGRGGHGVPTNPLPDVFTDGIEPPTSELSAPCSNQLSYANG